LGRYEDAVGAFEKLLLNFDNKRLGWSIWDAKADYYLARAYEETDNYLKAVEFYQAFINIYEDADTEIPEIADARDRLKVLDSRP
jgi:tetratricopeptide (TPR) repeat protein